MVEAGYSPELEVCEKVAQEGLTLWARVSEEGSGEPPGESGMVERDGEQEEQEEQEEDEILIHCSWTRSDALVVLEVLEVSASLLAFVGSRGQSL